MNCACGAKRDRRGQRRCKKCHAADMKLRRKAARRRGTNTIAGVRGIRRDTAGAIIEDEAFR
jgi:hypothetical protein